MMNSFPLENAVLVTKVEAKMEIQSEVMDDVSSVKCTRQCSHNEDDPHHNKYQEPDDAEFESFSLASRKNITTEDNLDNDNTNTNHGAADSDSSSEEDKDHNAALEAESPSKPMTDLFHLQMGVLLSKIQQHHHQHKHGQQNHQSPQQRARAMSVARMNQSAALAAAAAQLHAHNNQTTNLMVGAGCPGGVRRLSLSASPRNAGDTNPTPTNTLARPPRFPKVPEGLGLEYSRRSSAPSSLGASQK